MVLIKKHHLSNECAAVQITTFQNNYLFDAPAVLAGKNFRHPTFKSPPKSFKFRVADVRFLDAIFISSSASFGAIFYDDVRIYCTRPVYEQILLRFDEYSSLSATYDEECEHSKCLDDTGTLCRSRTVTLEEKYVKSFIKNTILIQYNQKLDINSFVVRATPSGTFIGWCNYSMMLENGEDIFYFSSYSSRRRFSKEAQEIKEKYVVMNEHSHVSFESTVCRLCREADFRQDKKGNKDLVEVKQHGLSDFTRFFQNLKIQSSSLGLIESQTIVIPLDMQAIVVEIVFHILSLLDSSNIPIAVVSPTFTKLELLINIQSEWLNKNFCSTTEPFPLRRYEGLRSYSCLTECIRNECIESPIKIVVCSNFEFELFQDRPLFKNQLVLRINESPKCMEELLRIYSIVEYRDSGLCSVGSNVFFHIKMSPTSSESLAALGGDAEAPSIIWQNAFIPSLSKFSYINISRRTEVFNDTIFLSGKLLISDYFTQGRISIEIEEEQNLISKLLAKNEYYEAMGWIVFYNENMRCRLVGDIIEIVNFK